MTGTMLGSAIAIAARVHETHRDMGGNAYILHPIRVMMRLGTEDVELACIAILHDCVEDSDGRVTIDSLKSHGFSDRVLSALALLTHPKDEPYDLYIRRVATSRDAILVKRADLCDNGDITRLKGLRSKDFERMEKYHRAYTFLGSTLAAMQQVGY